MKKIVAFFLFLLLTAETVFTFSSCGGKNFDSESSISLINENQYLSDDFNGSSQSITVGVNEKAYLVFDVELSGLKNAKKKKGDKTLTAEIYITCNATDKASFDFTVEDFPTNKYTFSEEKEYKTYRAAIEIFDGIEDTLNYRFIVYLSKPVSGEIKIHTGVEYWYNSLDESEGCGTERASHLSASVTVDENYVPESMLDYELSADNTYYTVSGVGRELGNRIIIPEKYRDLPVKAIADNAFINVNSISDIVIPEGIERIGASAFKGCTGIESFVIPQSVTEIGDGAFADCPDATVWCVTEAKPDGWSDSFKDENTPIIWKSGDFFTKISGTASYTFTFHDDKFPFETLNIPETYLGGFITYISGNGQHEAVSTVKSVKIPKTVEIIGELAFHNCYELSEIIFCAANCTSLNPNSPSFSGAGKNTDGITVTFTDTVKNIPGSLFTVRSGYYVYETPNVKVINISKFVDKVGSSAFEGCTSLESVTVSRATIGSGAFKDCSSLASVTIGDEVTKIENTAFRNCTALESITIGKGVVSIGNYAFAGCSGLKNVTFSGVGTWYTTKSTYDSDPSISIKMNTSNSPENAVMITDTYHDQHWFRR